MDSFHAVTGVHAIAPCHSQKAFNSSADHIGITLCYAPRSGVNKNKPKKKKKRDEDVVSPSFVRDPSTYSKHICALGAIIVPPKPRWFLT